MYRGGCLERFRELAEAEGDRVLYVGDHIYGDVLRAKKDTAWRTAMIIQEMDHELRVHEAVTPQLDRMDALEAVRDLLHEEQRDRQAELKRIARALEDARDRGLQTTELAAARVHHRKVVERIKARLRELDVELGGARGAGGPRLPPLLGLALQGGPRGQLLRRSGREVRVRVHRPRLEPPPLQPAPLLPQPPRPHAARAGLARTSGRRTPALRPPLRRSGAPSARDR
ncbi:MAG: HAD-IG family 5'-nucleotidase [Sandaracinaceae bacterium]|nr:HAD-IG family 5'-nucleotidase [Sandaracinaceae bacterium]